ncbi:MAG: hypothetical protein HC914_16355, partial [Chloroflexaceae bacterium]|nr:hypothetical protein [Chloroflexaceae bacterium]
MATRTNPQTNTNQSLWEQLTSAMSRGITPYILLTAYAIVVPFLAITNLMADARPSLYGDILFVAMLGTFLLLHKAPVTKTYSYVVAGILLCVVLPYFGTLQPALYGRDDPDRHVLR